MGSVAKLITSLLLILVLGSIAGGVIYGIKEYIAKCETEKREAQAEVIRKEREAREERLQMALMREEANAKAKREEAEKTAERFRLAQEAEAQRLALIAEEKARKAEAEKEAERKRQEEKEARERIRLAQEQAAEAARMMKSEENAFDMLKAAIQCLAPKNLTKAEWSLQTAQALLAEVKQPAEPKTDNPTIPKAVSLLRDPAKINALLVLCAESQRKNEQLVSDSRTKIDGGKLRLRSSLGSLIQLQRQIDEARRGEGSIRTSGGDRDRGEIQQYLTVNNSSKISSFQGQYQKAENDSRTSYNDIYQAKAQERVSQSVLDVISVIRDMLGQQNQDLKDAKKEARAKRMMFLKDGTKIAIKACMEIDGTYSVIDPNGDRRTLLKSEVDRIAEE